ncbi:T9SS C-terminal target domain-containing protein, partial [candidate division KSB1 bacterium]
FSEDSVPGAWTFYSHDLAALSDIPFYLAFVYNSTDRFALKIDDVQLEGTLPPYGCIAGIVTDDSARAISDVRVRILSQNIESRTDANGGYILTRVSPGANYLLQFQHEFYNGRTVPQVVVAANETTLVNASLLPLPLIFHDYVSVNSPRTIVDFDTIQMPLYGVIQDTLVIYDLDVSFTIQHSYVGDLSIWVRSPDSVYVQLAAYNPENAGQNFINCRLSDQAQWPLALGSAPYTGTWQPLRALSAFNGDSTVAIRGTRAYSTWYLAVYDSAEQDHGTITGFAIHVASEMPVPVQNKPRLQPEAFAFDGCYPNPFNAQTKLRFYLPHPARVQLVLYDVTGREVAALLNRNEEAGEHVIAFTAENLPSGVYFARLSAADFSATRKIILLK